MKHEHSKVSPPLPAEDAAYAALGRSEAFGGYRRAFGAVTGLHVGLLSARGATRVEEIVHDSPLASRSFCALMARVANRCLTCLEEQQKVAATLKHGAVTFECFPGLRRTLLPVRAGGRLVALLQSGPSLPHGVTPDELRAVIHGALRRGARQGDLPALEAAYQQTPVLEPERYEAAVRLLCIFAEHLGLIAAGTQRESFLVGLPVTEQAKRLIEDEHGNALSLGRVAQHVGLSPRHFSELFRRSTGFTFSGYLAQVRIERAKALLRRYPHLRIGEIAHRVGFRSLSQFNRTFHRLVGIAPKTFRARNRPG